MLVEAIDKPMCYRWPEGEVQLVPGRPVDLPELRALRLLQRAHGRVRLVTSASAFQPGDQITWVGADGTPRSGRVDFLHTSTDGTVWAFYTMPDGIWGAVNSKYVLKIEPEADRRTAT